MGLRQTVPNCPVVCTMDPSYDSAVDFDPTTGVVTVTELEWTRDSETLPTTVSCASSYSTGGSASVSSSFTVNFLDVCRTATLAMPDLTPATRESFLWPVPVDFFTFSPVSSSLNCGPYDYAIIANGQVIDGLVISEQGSNLAIRTQMDDLSMVGNWEVTIEACAPIGWDDFMCVESSPMTLRVKDPCAITTIKDVQPIEDTINASINSPDSFFVQWPMTDTVDQSLSIKTYGSGKCGMVKAIVTYADGTPCEFATFNDVTGEVVIDPTVETVPGDYSLYVHYYMENYPS